MHLCIAGGSFRVQHIIQYFLEETEIDLLKENDQGRAPFDIAIALNDEIGMGLLEEPTHQQLTLATPEADDDPDMELVP